MACAICGTRRPRRFCPGVRGDICTVCCGTEREVTVACPLDCEFLVEARRHDRLPDIDPEQIPNRDIKVTESFLGENEALLAFAGRTILEASLNGSGVVDSDVREALAALIRTYRSLQSGVYYETVPANPLAASVHRTVQQAVERFRQEERQRLGISKTRDADVLGCLVFLERLALDTANGRPRGRSFLSALAGFQGGPPPAERSASSSLIIP